jgi:uncharacterized membrane protein YeiH
MLCYLAPKGPCAGTRGDDGMDGSDQIVLRTLDYFGVAVFAISGGLAAGRKRMDPLGFALIGIVTGIGGGTLRDLFLGRRPFWVEQPGYLLVCIGAAVLTFFASAKLRPRGETFLWADAVGLAVFAVIGAEQATLAGVHWTICVVMGTLTATGGGVIRDVLCGEVPLLLRKEIYAAAALVGAAVFVTLHALGVPDSIAMTTGFIVGLGIRGLAMELGWNLPTFAGD